MTRKRLLIRVNPRNPRTAKAFTIRAFERKIPIDAPGAGAYDVLYTDNADDAEAFAHPRESAQSAYLKGIYYE